MQRALDILKELILIYLLPPIIVSHLIIYVFL
ncbi:hypothetical protein BpOF4_20924 (plasmid) [Alkalihalophilus pseudofirmus OF4]|uniref:Uncharacterized protein n=1 Tax=Alkalihalophilus pseudofirmus (strain ATCC BAA-2126 / JCM 17055 / OF4) TaxID=398511 RepID=D3G1F4_ALKPO|nr:hypothetical protein BpOF4_20924 [Alkalihalophilus pseudofirmus OF4]